ncbi:ABC transporter permease [Rhodoferax sp.]|uniref:ABC transporter permease n=1 Tax=Rhodoferax sp. TaxID=50421 RepID=UPI002770FE36|nr:ABC transporter permease subunit [Rhodoferax sp.]
MSALSHALAVFRKELLDALRDRRTLLVVLVSSVLLGPVLLLVMSGLAASFEAKAEQREVVVAGIEHAPSLKNYLERQTWRVTAAPVDYELLLRSSKLGDPVVVVPKDFEASLLRGDVPELELVSDSANRQSQSGARRVADLLRGFAQERVGLSLAVRGVSVELLSPLKVQERDLAGTQTRAAQFTAMLAFFVLLAVASGALTAALDSTAGERERGSLEPLLMNPVAGSALVVGKWGAVAAVSFAVAVLSCVSFLPAQWLLRSDTLQAMFQFGWREVGLFLVVLLPFAAAVSAVLMAVAIRCKSFKEAQANSTVVMLVVSLAPLVSMFSQSGEERWHLWVPALAQNSLMLRVLKGEGFTASQIAVPLLVCALLTAAGLWFVARRLRGAATK